LIAGLVYLGGLPSKRWKIVARRDSEKQKQANKSKQTNEKTTQQTNCSTAKQNG
jgi:hypothetical protein